MADKDIQMTGRQETSDESRGIYDELKPKPIEEILDEGRYIYLDIIPVGMKIQVPSPIRIQVKVTSEGIIVDAFDMSNPEEPENIGTAGQTWDEMEGAPE